VTTPRKAEIAKDRRLARPATMALDLSEALGEVEERIATQRWPSPKWRADPVGFARDCFGVELLSHQVKMLELVRDERKVAIRSGNKAGKSISVVLLALWFFSSFPDARVVMTMTTAQQINRVLWRQLKVLMARALVVLPGKMGERATTGLVSSDLREITGQTAAEVEAISGVSGANLLYIVDEASSLEQKFLEAIEGNTAGGGSTRIVMISNPTRVEGPFFDAFHSKKAYWATMAINCEQVAAENDSRRIPGIAEASTLSKWAEEYGPESVFYRVRVKGEFPLTEGGKAISFAAIQAAQDRWEDAEADGVLSIGVDPAGPGVGGDDTAFAVARGWKALDLLSQSGLDEGEIIERALGLIRVHRKLGEKPRLIVDVEGPIGGKLFGRLAAIAHGARPGHDFEVFAVKASDRAMREPLLFERTRDELFANLAKWIKDGGAIPPTPVAVAGPRRRPRARRVVAGGLGSCERGRVRSRDAARRPPGRSRRLRPGERQ
jgi:hypothetical protein